MNDTVSATGMEVKATASGGLYIATYQNTDVGTFGTNAIALNASATLSPVSTFDATNWFTTIAGSADSSDASATLSNWTTVATGGSGYYLVNRFIIKTSDGNDVTSKDLKIAAVTVSADSKSADLNDSLRVCVTVQPGFNTETKTASGTRNAYFFAPKYTDKATLTENKTVVKSLTKNGDGEVTAVNKEALATIYGGAYTPVTVEASTISGYSLVEIFVYYEGEDVNNKAANTANGIDSLTVDVSFKAESN